MKTLFISLFLSISGYITAQTLSIDYEMCIKLGEAAKGLPPDFVKSMENIALVYKFLYSKNKSEYIFSNQRFKDPAIPKLHSDGMVSISIYKDFDNNFLYQESKQLPGYVSKETLKKEGKWEIEKDTSTIMGYKCQKATQTNDSKGVISVWFTNGISISDGPGRFYGLPGIILRVDMENSVIEAVKVEIKREKENKTVIKMPNANPYLTRDEFDAKVKKHK
jgi:GLPGLI family protein